MKPLASVRLPPPRGFSSPALLAASLPSPTPPKGFMPLFNGKDFTGWKVPEGDNGHWKVVDGVIDYDAKSEAKGDKNLWTEKSYKDFMLRSTGGSRPDRATRTRCRSSCPTAATRRTTTARRSASRSRTSIPASTCAARGKRQVNIWMWPVGSGEVYGYRMDKKMPPEVRAGVTPKKKVDKPRGEWNTFEITLKGDRLWVKLNGEEVIANAQLPGIAAEGPIALQHHGSWNAKTNQWTGPPSLVQFRNISIKELTD